MPTLERRNRHSPPLDVSPLEKAWLTRVDALLEAPPIPPPKPWTDDVERAAIHRCALGTPPLVALRSFGLPSSTAESWLCDEPPPTYLSACRALSERLKCAGNLCESELLARIHSASLDPKHWTAAAWWLERSRGYIVKQASALGPAIVVNVGIIQAADTPRIQVRSDPQRIIDVVDDVVEATSVLTGQQLTDE